ncbi:MAG: pirin family protein [Thermonemataceae bacterium]
MANNKMIVEERVRDIGNFLVGRLLPFRKKRQVGPFTFIDHMGPFKIEKDKGLGVDQHPHIGLSTLTYLFEGQVEHRDSTGAVQIIRPGDVGFMTAGKGVAHTERTPTLEYNNPDASLHGYQVWVALPKNDEEMAPRFDFITREDLPTWQEGGLTLTLVAGEGYGKRSPLPVYSPLFMLDVSAQEATELDIAGNLHGEIALVIAKGQITDGEETIEAGQMLVSKTEDECCITLGKDSRVLIFGGQPFPEERHMYWNFVSSSKERIEQAKEEWKDKAFPKVPGDDTYIPLPS